MAPKAFVLMPFAPTFDAIYNLFIAAVLNEAGFDVSRADDLVTAGNVMADVVLSINEADLIVADLTGSNPNVYYELGLAHALRKPSILLTQDVAEVPFDLRSYRVLSYSTDFAVMPQSRSELLALAKGAFDGSLRFGSPVLDFLHPSATPTDRDLQPTEDSGALGYLDHLAQVEEGFEELGALVTAATEQNAEMAKEANGVTARIERIREESKGGGAKHVRAVVRD